MARKGKWLFKVKRFLACSKEDISNESNRRTTRERRKARRIQKQGEQNSFISRFKEPTSSIEKILEDAEREQGLTFRPPSLLEQPKKPSVVLPRAASPRSISPRATSPRAATPRIISPKATSPRSGSLRVIIPRARSPRAVSSGAVSPKTGSSRAVSPRLVHPQDVSPTPSPPRPPSSRAGFSKAPSFKMIHREEIVIKIDPVFPYHHVSANKIQAAYRGYMSRKRTGSGRGLLRLQQFVRGQSVRRQTANVMKQMQHLVRVQTRLQAQRFQTLECYALQPQEQHKSDKQADSNASDAGYSRDWDNSILTKEEEEARNKRKEEAVKNKERAMAFLQTHQISKVTSESAQSGLMDLWIDGLPWSWNWSECHMLKIILPADHAKKNPSLNPPMSASPRSTRSSIAPRGNQILTPPRNSRSLTPSRFSQMQTPDGTPRSHYSARSHYSSCSLLTKYLKPMPRGSRSPFDMHLTDTDSLKSCPAFSVPHYMSPTASARAKMRLSNNFKDRCVSSPSTESKRRMSCPLTPLSGTSRGPLFPDTDASSQRTVGTNCSSRSIDNISMGTPGSLADGRKPFNRFV